MTDQNIAEVAAIAAKLTKAQKMFVLSLPADGSEKHWPNGMEAYERDGLRGFGQSGLIAGRYIHSGVFQRLTPLGLAVRAHLLSENQQ